MDLSAGRVAWLEDVDTACLTRQCLGFRSSMREVKSSDLVTGRSSGENEVSNVDSNTENRYILYTYYIP